MKPKAIGRSAPADDGHNLPWSELPGNIQIVLNADFLAKEYRRTTRHKLIDDKVNDRRASIISFLSQIGPQTINELAHRLEQHKAAVSAILIRMNEDGLIDFTPHPTDKRSKNASLTKKGRQLAAPIQVALKETRQRALKGISRDEIEQTNAVLRRMIANLDNSSDD